MWYRNRNTMKTSSAAVIGGYNPLTLLSRVWFIALAGRIGYLVPVGLEVGHYGLYPVGVPMAAVGHAEWSYSHW